jgi:plasmid stabilization system protein ParE
MTCWILKNVLCAGTETTIDKILARTKQLEQHPRSRTVQPTPAHRQTYRYLEEGRYKIIYSYQKRVVYIHSVFDSRRDPGSMKL